MHETPSSSARGDIPVGLNVVQVDPFNVSMSTPLPIVPTATQEVVDAQDTLERLGFVIRRAEAW